MSLKKEGKDKAKNNGRGAPKKEFESLGRAQRYRRTKMMRKEKRNEMLDIIYEEYEKGNRAPISVKRIKDELDVKITAQGVNRIIREELKLDTFSKGRVASERKKIGFSTIHPKKKEDIEKEIKILQDEIIGFKELKQMQLDTKGKWDEIDYDKLIQNNKKLIEEKYYVTEREYAELKLPPKERMPRRRRPFEVTSQQLYKSDKAQGHLNPISKVFENFDIYYNMAKKDRNTHFDRGKYRVLWFGEETFSGQLKPFTVLARINSDGKVAYIQGAWVSKYMENALNKAVGKDYIGTVDNPVYIEIKLDILDETDDRVSYIYESIKVVD